VRATGARGRATGRPGSRLPVVLVGAGALLLVGATGLWAHHRLKVEVEQRIADDMKAVLDTAVDGVGGFLEGAEHRAALVAADPDVRAAAAGGAPAAALAPLMRAGKLSGFVVTDARGAVVEASDGLAARGQLLPAEILPAATAAHQGSPRAGLPFRAADGRVRLLVAAPLPGGARVLGLGLEEAAFSAPLLAARAGRTGETYAFDAGGRMISSSRFPQHLRRAGLIGPDEDDSSLRIEIRDPGGDTTGDYRSEARRSAQPLTVGAAGAIAGRPGVAVAPYRDYRGVPVVGAWTWIAPRGFGVLTEVDAAEAFQPLGALERIFGALLAVIALCGAGAVAGAFVAGRARRRAARAEQQARQLGEYVLERRLGGGAMGEVYLARHALLRRPTALKLLRAYDSDRIAIERFEREVKVTALLTHPNTIAIYDYGTSEGGSFYYAMEYLEGIDLERFVARFGACPDARVVHFLRQICGSLAEAHEQGLVHRDVKPANLFLCRRGGVPDLVKVLDFGLVKIADAESVTRTGVVIGTPENMAPELFESADRASPSSDIYALGCVGYYLLTGSRVFEGSSLAELCNAHLSRDPMAPSQRLGRPVDATLERVVMACLAKDPARRPASARAILELFDRSPIARAWSSADAAAFWARNAERIVDGAGPEPA
jgi:hypothetical protein